MCVKIYQNSIYSNYDKLRCSDNKNIPKIIRGFSRVLRSGRTVKNFWTKNVYINSPISIGGFRQKFVRIKNLSEKCIYNKGYDIYTKNRQILNCIECHKYSIGNTT